MPGALELHPVGKVTSGDYLAVLTAFGGAQFLRVDVVDALRKAVAAAIGVGHYRYRLLGTQPCQDLKLADLAEAGLDRHLVAHRPGSLLSHVPIMPDKKISGIPRPNWARLRASE